MLKRIFLAIALSIAFNPASNAQVGQITASACTVAGITVTNSSQQFLAGNGVRKVLIVQNNDASANTFVNFGAVATTAHIKVAAGQNLYISNPIPTQSVNIIGSTASNANVSLTECQ